MTRMRLMIAVLFLVAFGAGLTTSLAGQHWLSPPPPSRGNWLVRQLHLTAAQRKQMLDIWSGVSHRDWRAEMRQRRQFQQQRDEAIRQLVPTDQQPRYDAIQKQYREQLEQLSRERKARFEQAVSKTKAILTPEQRKAYEKILASHRPPHGSSRGGWHGKDRHHHGSKRHASSQPGG